MIKSTSRNIRALFYPRSIAVIGASADNQRERQTGWVGRLMEFGYSGRLYPINPRAKEILGLKAYCSIRDVPGPIDYAIIAVKAAVVPKALADCVSKQVKAVHVFSAGFNESGTKQGKALNQQLVSTINGCNTRVIGPNCMGIYCPAGGVTFNARFAKETGSMGIVSQSGAALMRLVPAANKRGILFSKTASYGNAIDLDSPDFLDYLVADPETQAIFCYIEGVKDGKRFFRAVRECTKTKPMVMLKGGLTEGGKGAAISHTGSLAGSERVWMAFFRQTGVILVDSFEEAVEQMVAVQNLKTIRGGNIGIVARGGGPGVVTADMCERAGLSAPEFTVETRTRLAKIVPVDAGSVVRNPVEIGLGARGLSQDYVDALEIVASDPRIDLILTRIGIESYVQYGIGDKEVLATVEALIGATKTLPKPLIVVADLGQTIESIKPVLKAQEMLSKSGIAVFSSMQSAVNAISKLIRYQEFVRQNLES